MPGTIIHVLSATTPDDPAFEIRPSHWNSTHAITLSLSGPEIIGAFSNANGVSFGTTPDGHVTASVQSSQSAQTLGVTALGNTTINSASTIDARSLGFQGAGNVSVGIVGSNVVISGSGGGAAVAIAAGTNVVTTGTAAFANSNNVSFGADAFGNVTASASYATGINISASNGAANLSSIVFGNANGASFGLVGSTLTASYTAPSIAGLLSAVGVSASNGGANLSGVQFSNSNGMAFGIVGSTLTGSYTVPSVAGLISGVAMSAGTQSTLGTGFVLANSNGISFGLNNGTITGSMAQSVQTEGMYALGNTTQGSSGTFDARSMSIVGAGNVSVGFSNGSLILSAVGTAPAGGVGISAGTQSTNTGLVILSNSNGVSFGLSNGTITATVNPGPAAGIGAVIAGTQTQTTGTMLFSNANGISFGLSNSSILTAQYTVPTQSVQPVAVSGSNGSFAYSTLSAGNLNGLSFYTSNGSLVGSYTVPTQTVQPVAVSGSNGSLAYSTLSLAALNGATFYTTNGSVGLSYTVPSTAGLISGVGMSAGTQASNVSALTFLNSNGVSFGLNAGTVTGSHALNISAGTQAAGYSALTFANSNNVSFGLNNGTITASASYVSQTVDTLGVFARGGTVGTSSATYDARSLSFSGVGNISVGNSAGAIVISGGGVNSFSAFAVSNTTQATSGVVVASGLSFAGAGAVSMGVSNGSIVISAAAGAQSVQTLGIVGGSNTTGTSSSTYDARFLTLAGAGIISVGNSNGSILISGPNTTGVTLLSAGVSNLGNTAGTTGMVASQLVLAGGSNVTLSVSTNAGGSATVSIIGGAGGTGGINSVSAFAISNTTLGTSATIAGSAFSFQGAGMVSVGVSNGSIVISGPGTTGISESVYATSNTTLSSSGTQSIGSLLFAGAGGVSVGASNGSIVVSSPLGVTQSLWAPPSLGVQTVSQLGLGTVQLFPAFCEGNFSASRAQIYVSMSLSTSSNSSWAGTLSAHVGLYTRTGSTLSLASSGSQSYAFTDTGGASASVLSGLCGISVPITMNATRADYWIGVISRTASANVNWFTASNVLYSQQVGSYNGLLGAPVSNSNQMVLGWGQYSATSTAMPNSMAFSDIRGSNATQAMAPMIVFNNVTA